MDYKEKYEMALEGIQEILGSGEDSIKMSRLQLRLQGVFPELKESEDEKIRKWIINEIKIKHHNLDEENVDFVDKAIAWLEKQGEKKSVWSEDDEVGLGDTLWAIKQARTVAKDENDMGNLWYAEKWLKSLKGRVQPKQEWSEEDKGIIEEVVSYLINYSNIVSKEDVDRIEYLIDKIQDICPHQKQEWSEEDEKMIRGLLAICDEWAVRNSFYPKENSDIEKLKNWLKSLRPLKRWKPSNKQMNVLWYHCSEGSILKSLYNDLKKLKES